MSKQLKRLSFDEAIDRAHFDYLFCQGPNAQYYAAGGEFHPTDTPNRNLTQVPNGTWRRILFKHINKHFYN